MVPVPRSSRSCGETDVPAVPEHCGTALSRQLPALLPSPWEEHFPCGAPHWVSNALSLSSAERWGWRVVVPILGFSCCPVYAGHGARAQGPRWLVWSGSLSGSGKRVCAKQEMGMGNSWNKGPVWLRASVGAHLCRQSPSLWAPFEVVGTVVFRGECRGGVRWRMAWLGKGSPCELG